MSARPHWPESHFVMAFVQWFHGGLPHKKYSFRTRNDISSENFTWGRSVLLQFPAVVDRGGLNLVPTFIFCCSKCWRNGKKRMRSSEPWKPGRPDGRQSPSVPLTTRLPTAGRLCRIIRYNAVNVALICSSTTTPWLSLSRRICCRSTIGIK